MLSIRKRGRYWHARGTVKAGRETRDVAEHSTGEVEQRAAQEYADHLHARVREEILYGDRRRRGRLTFADAATVYLDRPGGVAVMDKWRLHQINEVMGDRALDGLKDGWAEFRAVRCAGLAPATVNRFRDTLQAAVNHACDEWDIDPPRIRPIKFDNRRVRWLTLDHAERLLQSYAAHVRPIILTYRLQGCRAQEGLQLQWPVVSFTRRTIFFERTKNGQPRTVTMHHRVAPALHALWTERGRPDTGHVFLNRLGRPYADTRDYKYPGGNPLRQAHATALKRAGIRPNGGAGDGTDFTIHDWRHHWACHAVMNGVDLETIKTMGGWKSLASLERYTAVSTDHMAAAMRKMK